MKTAKKVEKVWKKISKTQLRPTCKRFLQISTGLSKFKMLFEKENSVLKLKNDLNLK